MGQKEGYKEHHNKTNKVALNELKSVLCTKKKPDKDISLSMKVMMSTLQMQQISVRSKVADQALADTLSKLIGGLKQAALKLFN